MRFVIFIVSFSIFSCQGQQIKLDGIDVRQIIIDDTLSVNQYLDLMNLESTLLHIKSKTEFTKRKILKHRIESKKIFYPNGKIRFKVDYGWKGGDSSRVYYEYDSTERLINAINYNSIFGKDDDGLYIKIEYDELSKVIKCETKYSNTSFGYNSKGSKEWVEFMQFHYRYSNRRRNESYLSDSSLSRYFYQYTSLGNLSCIVNSKNDTLVNFTYNSLNQLIEKNSFNIWSNRYRYRDGRIQEEDFLDHNNPQQDTTLNETCQFFYKIGILTKMECLKFDDYTENSIYEYKYNEKGLLSEVIRKNKKGKILKHTIYDYEYY